MSSERHPRGSPCQPQPSYPGAPPHILAHPSSSHTCTTSCPAEGELETGCCHGSPRSMPECSNPKWTHTQPLESSVETVGHTARGGRCLHGWGRRAGSARAAWQPLPFPSLQAWTTSIYTAWWRARGRVCPGAHPALHLGTPPPERPLEERVGRRWRGSTGDTTHPTTVAQARRHTAGAEAGGWPLWTGKSHR